MAPEKQRPLTSSDLQVRVDRWYRLWCVPESDATVEIEFSSRITRSLGRCFPDRNLIRLAASLAQAQPEFVHEVLAHEAAHLAAYRLYGRAIKPHGPEWKQLMLKAGYATRARVRIDHVPAGILGPPRRRRIVRRDPIAAAIRLVRTAKKRLSRASNLR
jgi:SprT protein